MEVARKLHDLRATGERPGEAQSQVRCLRPRHGEAGQLSAGDELVDQLRPPDLQLVAGAEVSAPGHLGLHCRHHRGVTVTEEERAVPHPVVHVLVAVHVPLPRSAGPIDVHREGHEVPDVVGDASRDGAPGALGQGA
jgi:hypothetical protein